MATVALLLVLNNILHAVNREIALRRTFLAVAAVESHGDPRAFNRDEDAAGIVQIRPIMLRDANRIMGRQRWSLSDRWNVEKSLEMFRLVVLHYHPQDGPEQWGRCWNGGPGWRRHPHATDEYWSRVQAALAHVN
jgi:hypothetical protein